MVTKDFKFRIQYLISISILHSAQVDCCFPVSLGSARSHLFTSLEPWKLEWPFTTEAYVATKPLRWMDSPHFLTTLSDLWQTGYVFGTIALVKPPNIVRVLYENFGHWPPLNLSDNSFNTYIHTYHSRFIPEGVAEVSQIFLRDVLPKLVSYEEHCRRDRW
jgi:hypothetical protein